MKRKQVLSVALAATMAVGMLAGCGSSSSGSSAAKDDTAASTEAAAEEAASTEAAAEETAEAATDISGDLNIIHYLTEDNKIAALDELVSGFEAEYPDVKVNVEAMSMDNYTDVIKLRFSTNEAPDVIFGQPKSARS